MFCYKILFCLSDSQISQQLLNLIAKHQNSVNSKNLHMYSWKIILGKHKRITLQSLMKKEEFYCLYEELLQFGSVCKNDTVLAFKCQTSTNQKMKLQSGM